MKMKNGCFGLYIELDTLVSSEVYARIKFTFAKPAFYFICIDLKGSNNNNS